MGRGNGQVQITTRSGTNRYTGTAVWNFRNSELDPNTWANNRQVDPATGKAVQPDWTNDHEYTISFGGPIIRNKTFFFALWDQRIRKEREVDEGIVLTDAARLGIFRFFDGWNPGELRQDRDNNTDAILCDPYRARGRYFGQSGPTQIQRQWDPIQRSRAPMSQRIRHPEARPNGNMVPFTDSDCPGGTALFPAVAPHAWDPLRPVFDPTGFVFRAALKDMPHANWFGANGTTDGLNTASVRWLRTSRSAGNTFGTSNDDDRKQFNIKIDHNFNASHKVAGSYTLERNNAASDLSNWPNGICGDVIRRPHIVSMNFTSTLGPTIVNEARFGFRGNYNQHRRPFETEAGAGLLDLVNSIQGGPDPGTTRNVGAIYPMQIEPTGGAETTASARPMPCTTVLLCTMGTPRGNSPTATR